MGPKQLKHVHSFELMDNDHGRMLIVRRNFACGSDYRMLSRQMSLSDFAGWQDFCIACSKARIIRL